LTIWVAKASYWVCLTFRAFYRLVTSWPVLSRMRAKSTWTLGPGVRVMAVERDGDRWVISAAAREIGFSRGAIDWKDALWAKFSTGAPARQRRCVERYSIVMSGRRSLIKGFDVKMCKSGCGHVFGLCARTVEAAGPDGVRGSFPDQENELEAPTKLQVSGPFPTHSHQSSSFRFQAAGSRRPESRYQYVASRA
jgi:hypothetical protein